MKDIGKKLYIIDSTAIILVGLLCLGYAMFKRSVAQLHIAFPFLNFPIFIGEICLFILLLLFVKRWRIQPVSLNKSQLLLIGYFVVVLLKAAYGYVRWGPLAFRHAALLYYPIFAVFGYSFYRVDFFGKKKCLVMLLMMVGMFVVGIYDHYWLFTHFVLAMILIRCYPSKRIRGLLLVGFFAVFPFRLFFRTARMMFVSNIFAFLFLIIATVGVLKIDKKLKIISSLCIVFFLLLGIANFSDTDAVKSILNIKQITNLFQEYDALIAENRFGVDVNQPLDVKLYSPDEPLFLERQRLEVEGVGRLIQKDNPIRISKKLKKAYTQKVITKSDIPETPENVHSQSAEGEKRNETEETFTQEVIEKSIIDNGSENMPSQSALIADKLEGASIQPDAEEPPPPDNEMRVASPSAQKNDKLEQPPVQKIIEEPMVVDDTQQRSAATFRIIEDGEAYAQDIAGSPGILDGKKIILSLFHQIRRMLKEASEEKAEEQSFIYNETEEVSSKSLQNTDNSEENSIQETAKEPPSLTGDNSVSSPAVQKTAQLEEKAMQTVTEQPPVSEKQNVVSSPSVQNTDQLEKTSTQKNVEEPVLFHGNENLSEQPAIPDNTISASPSSVQKTARLEEEAMQTVAEQPPISGEENIVPLPSVQKEARIEEASAQKNIEEVVVSDGEENISVQSAEIDERLTNDCKNLTEVCKQIEQKLFRLKNTVENSSQVFSLEYDQKIEDLSIEIENLINVLGNEDLAMQRRSGYVDELREIRLKWEQRKKHENLAKAQREKIINYSNTVFRLLIWRDMIQELIKEKPILGFDFGKPLRSKSLEIAWIGKGEWGRDGWIAAHNSYLHIIYRMGILGIFIIASLYAFLFKMIKDFFHLGSLVGLALCSIIINWFIAANFLVIFELPYTAIPIWTIFGMTYAYYQSQIKKNSFRLKRKV